MDQTEEQRVAAKNAPNDWRPPSSGPGWLERVFGINTFAGRMGCFASAAAIIAIPIVGVSYCSHQATENARLAAVEKAKVDAVEAAADEARYQDTVRTGKVCEDGPNGLNTALQLNVLRQLKDPDSFEHMGTVIVPSRKGGYDTLMRFRSRNSFGGYAIGTAVANLYVAERGVCEVRAFKVEG